MPRRALRRSRHRAAGRLRAGIAKKIHVDIDRSSINKNVRVDLPSSAMSARDGRHDRTRGSARPRKGRSHRMVVARITGWRARNSLVLSRPPITRSCPSTRSAAVRGDAASRSDHHHRGRPAPDVGGPAFRFRGPEPLADQSGGLGTMGYGLPAAIGAQVGNPDRLVIDIAGEASIADEHPGDVDRGAISPADQDLHPQQSVYGHGPPVAGADLRQPLFGELFRGSARFRQAGRGLWLVGPPDRESR